MNCFSIDSEQLLCSKCPNRNATGLYQCPGRWFFRHFGDKWTLPVLGALHGEPRRFSQIRNMLAPISERMLILSLKELEQAGLIVRDTSVTRAPRGTYRLTPVGRSLLDNIRDLYLWMNENANFILAAYAPEAVSGRKTKSAVKPKPVDREGRAARLPTGRRGRT